MRRRATAVGGTRPGRVRIRRWYASTPAVGFLCGRACLEASLSFSSLSGWARLGLRERFSIGLTDTSVRAYGDFLSYCLVAEGAVDSCRRSARRWYGSVHPDTWKGEAGGRLTSSRVAGPRGSVGKFNGLLAMTRCLTWLNVRQLGARERHERPVHHRTKHRHRLHDKAGSSAMYVHAHANFTRDMVRAGPRPI